MKKYAMILGLMLVFAPAVQAGDAACLKGTGSIVEGLDGTHYCKSSTSMNWWSAHAWCDSIGGELIDLTTECTKYDGEGQCPNLKGTGEWVGIWTRNVKDDGDGYVVNLSSGNIADGLFVHKYAALCIGF